MSRAPWAPEAKKVTNKSSKRATVAAKKVAAVVAKMIPTFVSKEKGSAQPALTMRMKPVPQTTNMQSQSTTKIHQTTPNRYEEHPEDSSKSGGQICLIC
jgi:hypothetical protein